MRLLDRLDAFRSPAVSTNGNGSRSASVDLYGSDRDAVQIIPNLDFRSSAPKSAAEHLPQNPLVFGPVFKIAMRMGALPIKVYTLGNGGVRQEDNDHPAYQLLRRPNPEITRNLMVSHLVTDLLTLGRGAWLKQREGSGPPVELWPLYGQSLRVVMAPRNLISHFEVVTNGKQPVRLEKEDVCYFRLMPDQRVLADGFAPFGPLSQMAELGAVAIGAGNDMFEHAFLNKQWAQAKRPLSNKAYNRLTRQLKAARKDKFSIPLLEEDIELKDSAGPSDAVVISALDLAAKIIRDTLGIPEDGDQTAFLKNAIQPVADAIEQELERSLMPEFEQPGFPQFAFRDELRGDPLQRAQLHKERIYSMQETPDEARRDEDRPPLPDGAGNQAWGPLNLVPVTEAASDGTPEPRDTQGGLGGDEGKDTLVSAGRSRAARARSNWSSLRDRVIERNAKAMGQKIRSVINKEAKAVKGALNDSRQARAEAKLPTVTELKKIIARSDKEIGKVLEQFMAQTGDASAPGAADFVDTEVTDEVLDRLHDVYQTRASQVTEAFNGVRGERITKLVEQAREKGTPIRELAGQIGDEYSALSTQYTDGIARTEVAFAHEQAALVTWADAGIRQIEVNFGGGPCTTGVCEDNASAGPFRLGEKMGDVGYSFEGAEAPPFHPGCTCFATPLIED